MNSVMIRVRMVVPLWWTCWDLVTPFPRTVRPQHDSRLRLFSSCFPGRRGDTGQVDREGVLRALAAALAVLAALLTPALVARAGAEPTAPVSQLADTVLPPEGPGARDWNAMDCRD